MTPEELQRDPDFQALPQELKQLAIEQATPTGSVGASSPTAPTPAESARAQTVQRDAQGNIVGFTTDPSAPPGVREAPFSETLMSNLETGLPMIGGGLGAAAGLALTKTPQGAAAGAGLGTAGGRAVAEFARPLITGEMVPTLEQYRRELYDGLLGALGEGIVPGVAFWGKKAWRGIHGVPDVIGPEIARTREIMHDFGRQLKALPLFSRVVGRDPTSAAELSLSQIAGMRGGFREWVEGIASGSILGGRRMVQFYRAEADAVKAYADDVMSRIGQSMTPSKAADAFDTLISDRLAFVKAQRTALYDDFRRIAGPVEVPTRDIASIFERFIKPAATSVARRGSEKIEIHEPYRKVMSAIFPGTGTTADLTKNAVTGAGVPYRKLVIDLDFAMSIRRSANRLIRNAKISRDPDAEVVGDIAKVVLARTKAAIDRVINPNAKAMLKFSDEYYKQTAERFQNQIVREILKSLRKESGKFVETLLQPHSPDRINFVKEAISERIYDKLVKPVLAKSFYDDVFDEASNLFNGKRLLQKMEDLGAETTSAAFGDDIVKELYNLGQAAIVTAKRPGESIYIKLVQASAAGTALLVPEHYGGGAEKAVAILVAPAMLGRILTSPNAIRTLTDGVQSTTPASLTRHIARLNALMIGRAAIEPTNEEEVAEFESEMNRQNRRER